jgi:hypothetical protein
MLIVMEMALLVFAGWGAGVLGVRLDVGRVHLQLLPVVERQRVYQQGGLPDSRSCHRAQQQQTTKTGPAQSENRSRTVTLTEDGMFIPSFCYYNDQFIVAREEMFGE